MEDKIELTTEELEAQHKEMIKQSKILAEQIKKRKQKEEEERKEKLSYTQKDRKKEVDDALEHYHKVLGAYVEDYGMYSLTSSVKDDDLFGRMLPWWF